jgi:hydroxymethylbilane synthase
MRLLTRGSPLAIVQAERMADAIRSFGRSVEIVPFSTRGDREASRPLRCFGGSGAFSCCIEEALLRGEGEGAVHSLKDIPSCCRDGLDIAAVLPRDNVEDVLIGRDETTLASMPPGAVVGTSSPRRRAQILRSRPDLATAELRGNVATRLSRLREGQYDAVILARAGLDRLGLLPSNAETLPSLPAPCQGIIALEAPLGSSLFSLGTAISCRNTFLCALAERTLLRTLRVGCHIPFAALARLDGKTLDFRAEILDDSGRDFRFFSTSRNVASPDDAVEAGMELAERIRTDACAMRILAATLVPTDGRP